MQTGFHHGLLDVNLPAAGIRSMVTARAKNASRLESKVRQRAAGKTYASVDAILDGIVDLAGVRVALYCPGEREQVDTLVRSLFTVISAKEFPEDPEPVDENATPSYEKRFSGYWAMHDRVRLKELSIAKPKSGAPRVESCAWESAARS